MLRRAITALRMRDSPSAEEEGMRWLLLGGRSAGDLMAEAIGHLERTRALPELARAHMLYGEWLADGRDQRRAHPQQARIGLGIPGIRSASRTQRS